MKAGRRVLSFCYGYRIMTNPLLFLCTYHDYRMRAGTALRADYFRVLYPDPSFLPAFTSCIIQYHIYIYNSARDDDDDQDLIWKASILSLFSSFPPPFFSPHFSFPKIKSQTSLKTQKSAQTHLAHSLSTPIHVPPQAGYTSQTLGPP